MATSDLFRAHPRAGGRKRFPTPAKSKHMRLTTPHERKPVSLKAHCSLGATRRSQRTGIPNPFRWVGAVGYYYDGEVGTYYVRARNYDTTQATWLSQDPLFWPLVYGIINPFGFHARQARADRKITSRIREYHLGTFERYVSRTEQSSRDKHNLFGYSHGSPITWIDPRGETAILAGCGIGLAAGAGASLLVNLPNIGNPKQYCCQAFCSGIGGCVTGGITGTFLNTWSGCVGGVVGSLVASACESGLCGTRGPMGWCDLVTAMINGILGCFGGALSDGGGDTDAIFAALGMDVAAFTAMCENGGPGPQIGKACCTFDNGHTIWSETVDCSFGQDAQQCCSDHANGWIVDWSVNGSRNGEC